MSKQEKIRKVYQQYGIKVENDIIEEILKDKVRTEKIMQLYDKEF